MACALERALSATRLAENDVAAQAAVSDYLLAEVLEREPRELRRFLLRTSIVDRLTPELAVLLAEDPNAGLLLDDLHRRGVFVVALDDGWFRYHNLFALLLRARLRVEDPLAVMELHRRAAEWLHGHDATAAARVHALRRGPLATPRHAPPPALATQPPRWRAGATLDRQACPPRRRPATSRSGCSPPPMT